MASASIPKQGRCFRAATGPEHQCLAVFPGHAIAKKLIHAGNRSAFTLIELLVVVAIIGILGTGLQGAEQERDWMKAFLNDRPPIREFVFSSSIPPLVPGGTNRAPTKFYLVRWENMERFFVAESKSLTNLSEPWSCPIGSTKWYSADKARWWYIDAAKEFLIAHVWETSTPRDECCNNVFKSVAAVRDVELYPALNLGIWYAPMGGIIWKGDRYQFSNALYEVEAAGVINRDAHGRVESVLHDFTLPIKVDGKSSLKTFHHLVRYRYDQERNIDLPDGFPNAVQVSLVREANPLLPIKEYVFHELVIPSEDSKGRGVAMESMSDVANRMPMVVYMFSNRTEYTLSGKNWVPRLSPDDRSLRLTNKVPPQPTIGKRVFVVALLLTPTIFLAVWLGKKTKQQQINHH